MDRIDGNDAAFSQAGKGGDDYVSRGREGDGAIQLDGRLLAFAADPGRADRLCQLPVGGSPGGNVDLAVLPFQE